MKKVLYIFVLINLIYLHAEAQQVVSLMQTNSYKTYITLPFRLEDSSHNSIPIINVSLVNSASDCLAIMDPYISSNFLVKCKSAKSISLYIYFKYNDVISKIQYGPIDITNISDSGIVTPVDPGGSDPYSTGRELFNTKCMRCHQSPYDKPNKSVTQITNAINNVGAMKTAPENLQALTSAELKAISDYLNHLP